MERKLLATVEGKPIYADQLDLLIAQATDEQKRQFQSPEGRERLLDEMIAQELFYQEAKKNKLEETETFKLILEEAKEKLIKSHAIAEFMKQFTASEKEAKAFYDNNPKEFIAPDSVRASHILLPAEQQAIDILEEIKANKKTFEEAAKEYSTCPSKENGGDLSYFQRGQMVPEFEEAAYAMKVGEITDQPVKTQFGFHIIKVTDRKTDEVIPYDTVKKSVMSYLSGQKQNDEFLNHIEALKKVYKVEIAPVV